MRLVRPACLPKATLQKSGNVSPESYWIQWGMGNWIFTIWYDEMRFFHRTAPGIKELSTWELSDWERRAFKRDFKE